MPTVLEDGPYAFVFFSSDWSEPPHIHVKRGRQMVKYWLHPVSLAKNRKFKNHELRKIARLVAKYETEHWRHGMATLVLENEPAIVKIMIKKDKFEVALDDGRGLSIPIKWYPRLMHATAKERKNWRLLGKGYAIEWPDLDEHIGVEGLLAGRRSGESRKSFERWLASRK